MGCACVTLLVAVVLVVRDGLERPPELIAH